MNLAGPPSLYIFQVLKEVWSFPVVDLSSEFPGKHWTMKKICHFTLWQIHLHQTCVSFLSRHQTTFLFINWCFFLTDCPPKAPSLVIASFGTGLQLNALVSYIGIYTLTIRFEKILKGEGSLVCVWISGTPHNFAEIVGLRIITIQSMYLKD